MRWIFLMLLVLACTRPDPLAIAKSTPEIQSFIERYDCDGCASGYPEGRDLDGCVEHSVSGNTAEFWVCEACSFRYGETQKVRVTIDHEGKVVFSPDREFIKDPAFCRDPSECMCLSGSGVEFVGCANFLHAQAHFAGAYACDRCGCESGKYIEKP